MRSNDWVLKSKNRIFLDMHFPYWKGKDIGSNFDTDKMVRIFSSSHVDSVILYAKCQYGNYYYNTLRGYKHPGLGEQDLFREFTEKAHSKEIKIIAYYSVAWDERMASRKPEWLVEGADGTRDNLEEFRWSTLCINSPYRDIVLRDLEEIAKTTDTDGFWLDMTIIGRGRCYCSYCRKKFKDRFGREMPEGPGHRDWHLLNQWRYDYIEDFYKEAVAIIKAIDKNIIVSNNYWGYPYKSGTMGSRAVGSLKSADFGTGEAYTDWTGLNAPAIFSKYLRGASDGKPFEVLVGRFYNTWDYTLKPYAQMAYEAYTVIANGGTVTLDDMPYHDGSLEEEVYSNVKAIFETINPRLDAIEGAEPIKFAAILHSQASKDYHHNYGEVSFIPPIAGAYKVFRDLHLPVDFVFDENLNGDILKDYKVLVLPDATCMSRNIADIIRGFVEEGGLLISTHGTSLYNEVGEACENFMLGDVLGVDYIGPSDYSITYFNTNGEILGEELKTRRPLMFNGPYIKSGVRKGATVLTHIINPICETRAKTFFHNNQPAPYKETDYPALVFNRFGKGYSYYLASEVFSAVARKGQREVKSLVSYILRAGSIKTPIKVNCPSTVDVIMNSIGKKEIIIHLINPHMELPVCYGHMEVFNGYYDRTLECIEDVIPLYDIEVDIELPRGKNVKAIKVYEGEGVTSYSQEGNRCKFRVHEINLWQTVRITIE